MPCASRIKAAVLWQKSRRHAHVHHEAATVISTPCSTENAGGQCTAAGASGDKSQADSLALVRHPAEAQLRQQIDKGLVCLPEDLSELDGQQTQLLPSPEKRPGSIDLGDYLCA